MHYFKRNIGDYHKKAGRLSMLEHGAYTLLMDACYDRERFPTEEEAIDWCWARSDDEIAAVRFVLTKFFSLEDGRYVQQRIQDEIDAYHARALKNKEIAEKREADKRMKREQQSTKRAPVVNESAPNQEPLTNNQEPINPNPLTPADAAVVADAPALGSKKPARDKFDPMTAKPENVSAKAWADWCQFRREIRKPLTATMCKQQAKVLEGHYDPDAVLAVSITNGWTGIFPEKVATNVRPIQQSRFVNLPQVNADELRARAEENKRLGVRRANF